MAKKIVLSIDKWREILNEKVAPVRIAGVSKRVISHWLDIDLITDDRTGDGKDRYFTYMEYFWVCIIRELREFGMPLSIISKVKEEIDKPVKNKYSKNKLPKLEVAVLEMIKASEPLFMVISNKGDTAIYNYDAYEYDFNSGFYTSYVTIRLHRLFKSKINNIHFNTKFNQYMKLTKGEESVMDALYDKNTQSVKVIKKDNSIELIEIEQYEVVEKRIIDLLKDQNYQNIEITQHNGKITKIKRTIKKKIKSSNTKTNKNND